MQKKEISNIWTNLEKNHKQPQYYRNISEIDSKKFIEDFDKLDIQEIIANFYKGDFLIIKNAISKNFLENLKLELIKMSKSEKSTFHKILDNCPNFHRIQDESTLGKYSLNAIRHSFYFFRWNSDKMNLFKTIDPYWEKIKFLGGLTYNQYKNNYPKDGIVDRMQVVRYPNNSGFIEPHQHHPLNQRLIISVYMPEKFVDFNEGGTYFINKNNSKIHLENKISAGDIGIFYATMKHGVDAVKIDKNCKNYDNEELNGRWWIGAYSPESDYHKERNTSNPTSIK